MEAFLLENYVTFRPQVKFLGDIKGLLFGVVLKDVSLGCLEAI